MRNYFNYFTEIEERFQSRRGSLLMLSTLDWSLIETWRESGIPLEAVLRGIDDAFDKHDARATAGRRGTKKVNGLAWCSQSVMEAAEALSEAAIGLAAPAKEERESGFEDTRIATYLLTNAALLEKAQMSDTAKPTIAEAAARLRALAEEPKSPEETERLLTALEEKLFAALRLSATTDEIATLKAQAERELAPYRGKMQPAQRKLVEDQFLNKRLLEARGLPRLSLFYMGHG